MPEQVGRIELCVLNGFTPEVLSLLLKGTWTIRQGPKKSFNEYNSRENDFSTVVFKMKKVPETFGHN